MRFTPNNHKVALAQELSLIAEAKEQFTREETKLLRKYGWWLMSLRNGWISPCTDTQVKFLNELSRQGFCNENSLTSLWSRYEEIENRHISEKELLRREMFWCTVRCQEHVDARNRADYFIDESGSSSSHQNYPSSEELDCFSELDDLEARYAALVDLESKR